MSHATMMPDAFWSMALFCYFVSLFKRYPAEFLKNISHMNFITWTSIHSCSTRLESGVFVLERPHSYPPNARNNQNMGGLKSFKERVSFSEVGSTTVQMLYHRRYLGKAATRLARLSQALSWRQIIDKRSNRKQKLIIMLRFNDFKTYRLALICFVKSDFTNQARHHQDWIRARP